VVFLIYFCVNESRERTRLFLIYCPEGPWYTLMCPFEGCDVVACEVCGANVAVNILISLFPRGLKLALVSCWRWKVTRQKAKSQVSSI